MGRHAGRTPEHSTSPYRSVGTCVRCSTVLDPNGVAAATARRLSLSVRALTCRLARIHALTGTDPVDPAHRYTLQTAVIGARPLDRPTRPLTSAETPIWRGGAR
ncbi:helix-turn-helix domain-containing protein [Streptomyces sp. NBC_00080]|nr:helix-turn-helix domain-containing protein [Streptomyces coriariae]